MRGRAAIRWVLGCLGVIAWVLACLPAFGEEHSFNFSDLTGLKLNGSAATIHANGPISAGDAHVLRLTDGLSQIGSAYLEKPVSFGPETSFSTSFTFQLTSPQGFMGGDGPGGDGIALVIQPKANTVVGAIGGALGYEGLDHSLVIEFDTWHNAPSDFRGGDPDGNHVGVNLNGDAFSVATASVAPRFNDGTIWHVWIDYDAGLHLLQVRVTEAMARPELATLTARVNLEKALASETAYVGFSGAGGGASNVQDILSWQFTTTSPPAAELDATETKIAPPKATGPKAKPPRIRAPIKSKTPKASS